MLYEMCSLLVMNNILGLNKSCVPLLEASDNAVQQRAVHTQRDCINNIQHYNIRVSEATRRSCAHEAYTLTRVRAKSLDSRRLGARSERVRQTALATVLTVLVEGHLHETLLMITFLFQGMGLTKIPAPHSGEGHSRRRRLILPSDSTL